jgi:hypothetical protein
MTYASVFVKQMSYIFTYFYIFLKSFNYLKIKLIILLYLAISESLSPKVLLVHIITKEGAWTPPLWTGLMDWTNTRNLMFFIKDFGDRLSQILGLI